MLYVWLSVCVCTLYIHIEFMFNCLCALGPHFTQNAHTLHGANARLDPIIYAIIIMHINLQHVYTHTHKHKRLNSRVHKRRIHDTEMWVFKGGCVTLERALASLNICFVSEMGGERSVENVRLNADKSLIHTHTHKTLDVYVVRDDKLWWIRPT